MANKKNFSVCDAHGPCQTHDEANLSTIYPWTDRLQLCLPVTQMPRSPELMIFVPMTTEVQS